MGLSGILSLLKGLGKGAKSAFTPIATHKTPIDEFLHLQKGANIMEFKYLGKILKVAEKESKRVIKELNDLTNEMRTHNALLNTGAYTPQSNARKVAGFKERIEILNQQKKSVGELFETLAKQGELNDAVDIMNKAAHESYRLEKAMGLTKGALVGAGAAIAGIEAGKAFGDKTVGEIFREQEPEAAVEEMEEVTQTEPTFREKFESGQWGEPAANLLMDVISPIPRYTDINNGRE